MFNVERNGNSQPGVIEVTICFVCFLEYQTMDINSCSLFLQLHYNQLNSFLRQPNEGLKLKEIFTVNCGCNYNLK